MFSAKTEMVSPDEALEGRSEPLEVPDRHRVLDAPLDGPLDDDHRTAYFGMGCFWGAERLFWRLDGVVSTAVGYQGGYTPNPTYEEVCSGRTGHTEAVRVVYRPASGAADAAQSPDRIGYEDLLRVFWENHDPTQGMRQGNDVGTQYRSAIYVTDDEQRRAAKRSRDRYQARLSENGHGEITTEIADAPPFYLAEGYHQQYLDRNPHGYCNHGFCQVSYE